MRFTYPQFDDLELTKEIKELRAAFQFCDSKMEKLKVECRAYEHAQVRLDEAWLWTVKAVKDKENERIRKQLEGKGA